MRSALLFHGSPVEIQYRGGLRDTAGNPAHAATYIRRRLIILDTALRTEPGERERVILHEQFHFVWVRLSNATRRAWEEHLRAERAARARGEAGWSAEWRKRKLTPADVMQRTRFWREYCCESFCDTGAAIHAADASKKTSKEITLASGRLARRAAWFQAALPGPPFPI